MQVARQSVTVSRLERILAILAAVVCVTITLVFWVTESPYQSMWPLLGFYFVEIVSLSFLSTFMFVRGDPRGSLMTWVAAGVMRAISFLGAASVGLFYLPVALMFIVIYLTWDVRNKQNKPARLGTFLITGIVQSALMLAAIGLHNPGTVF
jgi:predicted membrane protein